MPWNNNIGIKGEDLAEAYFKQQEFLVLEKNWRHKHWEVDLIASKNNKLHFIEVKTRTSETFGKPEESINHQKMECLKNAAEEYLYKYPEWKYIQFDVLAITIIKNKPIEYFLIEDVYF